MMDRREKGRIRALFILIAVIAGIFCFRLFKLQGTGAGAAAAAAGKNSVTYQQTVRGARGSILDRNGTALVVSRAVYNVNIVNFVFMNGDDPNADLERLWQLCAARGVTPADHLPVTADAPYTYTDVGETWKGHFTTYLKWRGWDPEISAKTLIANMKKTYSIPASWDEATCRRVLGLRYELDLRYCAGLGNYTLAGDVSSDTLAALLEAGIPGVIVETDTVREYKTKYAAHILGRIGPMNAEEWKTYKDQGYSMDAQVGKDGLEQAFESYLRGTDGTRITTASDDGAILDTNYKTEPKAGDNVTLTIDIGLQAAAEDGLAATIEDLRQNGVGAKKEGKDAEGGAVVAVDCKTGEVLASASYPTFDLSTYSEKFNQLLTAPYSPIYNRALAATYFPGSVYKMVTAIAAIDRGGIGRWREITDKGVYTYYKDSGYTCNCYIYTSYGMTHGTINMMQAISESCNYYFYEVGRLTGITAIDEVAAGLGLGEKTGVELYEEQGTRANPATKKALYGGVDAGDWYGADTLQAAIGQSDNRFTPLQMATYTATLANSGERMKATFLRRVSSWDYSELLYDHAPESLGKFAISGDALACIREGMRLAATDGTAASYLSDYPVAVCAKTGTAQHGGEGSDNASFVCYAPADDPEIAIAIYVEKGAQGGNLGRIARAVLDEYFSRTDGAAAAARENTPS